MSSAKSLNLKTGIVKATIFFTVLMFYNTLFTYIYSMTENININDITIYSKSAILMDNDTGNILYSKNAENKIYPASTTKILTAILAIENLDINKTTIVTNTAANIPLGSSNVALKPGEIISIKDLLYCLLLNSGNDSANVLSEAVSGTIPEFISLMNSKTKELGLINTNFTNAHGFHDPNHYTSALDMMKIFNYALKNKLFKSILETKTYIVNPTNKTNVERILQNTNRLILNKNESYLSNYYEYCLGGKTGYTEEAGRTFIAFGKKDDTNLIIGTFNAMNIGQNDARYVDSITLFEYGFNNFTKYLAINKDNFKFEYIDNSNGYKYILGVKEDIYFNIKKLEKEQEIRVFNLTSSITNIPFIDPTLLNAYSNNNVLPNDCQVVGKLNIKFDKNLQSLNKNVDLVVINKSKIKVYEKIKKEMALIFKFIVYTIFLIIVLLFLILISIIMQKKKKQNKLKLYNMKK